MTDNFYKSHVLGLIIGLLICVTILQIYIIVTEQEEDPEIRLNHAIIIKGQEKSKEREEQILTTCGDIENILKEWGLIDN